MKLCITISKYHSWYLCQISLQIMLYPRLICNHTCENTKLPWQTSLRLSAKMAAKFSNIRNKDVRGLKDALENLNTRERTHQEGFYLVCCQKVLKVLNLSQKLSYKVLSAWSSQSIINLINMLKSYDCESYSSPMILIGNQMVYSWNYSLISRVTIWFTNSISAKKRFSAVKR